MTIGEKIFRYRKQAGLSQEDLAYKMNVTRQSVSLWETDQTMPSLESLIMLSEIFSVSLDDLCASSAKPAETASETPEKEEHLACAQTRYTPELVKHLNKRGVRKLFVILITAIILTVCIGIGIIFSDTENTYLIMPLVFIIMLSSSLTGVGLSLKKRTAEFLKLHPNGVVTVKIFQDFFTVESTSDNTDSKATVRYSEIKKVINDKKCILIYYGNTVVPIEKNQPDTNYDLILKFFNVPNNGNETRQNGKIKALLLAMFILSLLSVFLALVAVAIGFELSPLPEFPYSPPEHMWIFFVFIPLPLASAVLGIVFYTKKYRCKKNIIAGFIMCAILFLFGTFSLIFSDGVTHDFGYVRELEQTISIDLPDNGYISRRTYTDSPTNSVAMIKFDDADEICNIVSADGRFSTERFIPSDFIDMFYSAITSDYNYFMLYDLTGNEVNVIPDSPSEEHRFIFVAYHIDKNILFVLDFVK